MELSLVIAAVVRRLWLPVLFGLLGGIAANAYTSDREGIRYEATAVLLVQPPTSTGAPVFISDPDRYVISQLPALRSLAPRVEDELDDLEPGDLAGKVEINHEPTTDLVDVTITHPDPERAAAIADAYADLYIEDLSLRAADARSGDLEDLDTQIQALSTKLADLEQRIYASTEVLGGPNAPVGTVVTDTAAYAERQLVVQELNTAVANRAQLELATNLKVNSEVVSYATVPFTPVSSSSGLMAVAGAAFGALLGVAAAIIWAQASPMLLAPIQVSQELGHPVVGRLARSRRLSGRTTKAMSALPPSAVGVIDQLCVRAEAHAGSTGTLTVAVVGSKRDAGCSTLAAAMAGRFAASGSRVVLVDGDQLDPELTRELGATQQGGIPALLAASSMADEAGQRRAGRRTAEIYTATPDPDVTLLGHGPKLDVPALHRTEVRPLLDAAAAAHPVVTVDAGSLPDSAVTVQFCQQVDAVVVAVPLRHQRRDGLEVVARQLKGLRAEILPVITEPRRSRLRRRREPALVAVPDTGQPAG